MISSNSHIKYANALFKTAVKTGAAEAVLRDLEELSAVMADERFRATLKKIVYLEKSRLEKVLTDTFKERLNAVSMNLLVLLARARKLTLMSRIFDSYSHNYHAAKKISEIKVCTARKLNSDEEVNLIDRLQQKLDKPVSVRFTVNPQLIGGIQVYERGYVTDFTVKNYLETLKKHLLAGGE